MKVTRADWAGSVPWAGITGKPDNLLSGGGAVELSQLTARVGAMEAAIVALTTPTGDGDPSPASIPSVNIWWAVGDIEPLQMAYEDLTVPAGAPAGAAFAVSAPLTAFPGVVFEAYSLGEGVLRLVAVNLSGSTVTLPMTNFTLFILNG